MTHVSMTRVVHVYSVNLKVDSTAQPTLFARFIRHISVSSSLVYKTANMPRDSSSSTSRSRRIAKRSSLPKLAHRAPAMTRRISMRLAERAEGSPENLPVASEDDHSVEGGEKDDHSRERRIGHARARASLASTSASVSSAKLKASQPFFGACI